MGWVLQGVHCRCNNCHSSCDTKVGSGRKAIAYGCGFFAYSWKLPSYNGALLLTVDDFCFFSCSWSCFGLQWEAASNKGLKGLEAKKLNCKQKAPTVSKKASPIAYFPLFGEQWFVSHSSCEGTWQTCMSSVHRGLAILQCNMRRAKE